VLEDRGVVLFEPVQINPPEILYKDINAGMAHTLMVDNEGFAYGLGGNMRHQLGKGGEFRNKGYLLVIYETYGNSITQPKKFQFEEPIVSICAGRYHSVFLSSSFIII
jgi:alpha-tubulin suppressor-like RCC1 family protein